MNQCRLQEASSREGDSLPQTQHAHFDFLHKETAKKIFNELLCRDPRRAQGPLGEDLHRAQGSMIRRSSLDAELACVTVLRTRTLCW
jgi:hypothetical protein